MYDVRMTWLWRGYDVAHVPHLDSPVIADERQKMLTIKKKKFYFQMGWVGKIYSME